jgi:hypothetical protein
MVGNIISKPLYDDTIIDFFMYSSQGCYEQSAVIEKIINVFVRLSSYVPAVF